MWQATGAVSCCMYIILDKILGIIDSALPVLVEFHCRTITQEPRTMLNSTGKHLVSLRVGYRFWATNGSSGTGEKCDQSFQLRKNTSGRKCLPGVKTAIRPQLPRIR